MLRLRRVDKPEQGNAWSKYTGTYEDQFQNTYHVIRWWCPGLWWLILRDPELKGKRTDTFKAAHRGRRVFIK
jgi:hypothetical protein